MGEFDHFTKLISKPLWPQTTTIYFLRDSRDGRVGYAGACLNPRKQLSRQLFDAKIGKTGYLYSWLRSLLRLQLRPTVTLLAVVPKYQATAQLAALKKTIHYVEPEKAVRGKDLKNVHDLNREATADLPDYDDLRPSLRDARDRYIQALKRNLRKYGPKSRPSGTSPRPYALNPLELKLLDEKVRRAYLTSLACKKPWK